MGFQFSKNTVDVEIEGEVYVINLGDEEFLDKIEAWGEKLQKINYEKLAKDGTRMKILTNDIHSYLKALLGDDQFDVIVKRKGSKLNLIDSLELFAYLWSEVNQSKIGDRFGETLSKYMPDVDPQTE